MTSRIDRNDEATLAGRVRILLRHLGARLLEWMRSHPRMFRWWRNAAIAALFLAVLGTIEHYRELHSLEQLGKSATTGLEEFLALPLDQPDDEGHLARKLEALQPAVARPVTALRNTRHPLAPAAKEATLAYADQIATVAARLHAMAASERDVAAAIAAYDARIADLQSSGYGTRAAAQIEANRAAAALRRATELAYRESLILQTYVDQLEFRHAVSQEYLPPEALLAADRLARLRSLAAQRTAHTRNVMKTHHRTARF